MVLDQGVESATDDFLITSTHKLVSFLAPLAVSELSPRSNTVAIHGIPSHKCIIGNLGIYDYQSLALL